MLFRSRYMVSIRGPVSEVRSAMEAGIERVKAMPGDAEVVTYLEGSVLANSLLLAYRTEPQRVDNQQIAVAILYSVTCRRNCHSLYIRHSRHL